LANGAVARRIELTDRRQVGSSAGLAGRATALGF
jgi:hypothetical protein